MNLYEGKENINCCPNGKIIIYRLPGVKRKFFLMENKDLHLQSKKRKISKQGYNDRNTSVLLQHISKSKLSSSCKNNKANSSTNDLTTLDNMCVYRNPYFSCCKEGNNSDINASFSDHESYQSTWQSKTEAVSESTKTEIINFVTLSSDSEVEEDVGNKINKHIKDLRDDIKISSIKSKKNFKEIVDLTLTKRTEPAITIDLTVFPNTDKTSDVLGNLQNIPNVSRKNRRNKKHVEAIIDLTSPDRTHSTKPDHIDLTTPDHKINLPTVRYNPTKVRSDSPVFVTEVSRTCKSSKIIRSNASKVDSLLENVSKQTPSNSQSKRFIPLTVISDDDISCYQSELNLAKDKDMHTNKLVQPLSNNTDDSIKIYLNASTETNSDLAVQNETIKIKRSIHSGSNELSVSDTSMHTCLSGESDMSFKTAVSGTSDIIYLSSDEDLPDVSFHISQKYVSHEHSSSDNESSTKNSANKNVGRSFSSPNNSIPEIYSPDSFASSDDACDLPVVNLSSHIATKTEFITTAIMDDEPVSDSDKSTEVSCSSDDSDSLSEEEIHLTSFNVFLEHDIEEIPLNNCSNISNGSRNKCNNIHELSSALEDKVSYMSTDCGDSSSENFNLIPITLDKPHKIEAISEGVNKSDSIETSRTDYYKKQVSGDIFCSSVSKVLYEDSDLPYLRFNMSYWSECCENPYNCSSVHQEHEASEIPHGQAKILQSLIEEKMWENTLSFFSYVLNSSSYPSPEILLCVLAFIRDTEDMGLRNIAGQMIHTFLEYHPPCAPRMKTYYLNVLHSELSFNDMNITADGFFRDVLSEIEKCLFSLDNLGNEELADDDSYACSFDVTRDLAHRLGQLCFVLKLMVEVLECDMAVWLVKHNFNPKNAMKRYVSRPLIALLFWKSNFGFSVGNFSLISDSKFLFKIYALCAKLHERVHPELCNVISRLLSLIGEVIRSTDFDYSNSYPHFGSHTDDFARELALVFVKFSITSCLKMVQNLHVPWLVMLVSHYLLSFFIGRENSSKINLEIAKEFLNSNAQYFQNFISTQAAVNFNGTKSVNKRDHCGETRLHFVCRNNRLHELSTLLSDPNIDVNAEDNFGWTGLHEAINRGHAECVDYLLQWKPDKGQSSLNLRAKNRDGISPLMYAVIRDEPEICKLLLNYGGSALLCDKANDGKKATDMIQSESVKKVLNEKFDFKVMCHDELNFNSSSLQYYEFLITFVSAYVRTYRLGNVMRCLRTRNYFEINREGKPNLIFDYVQVKRDIKFLTNLKSLLREECSASHVKKISLLLDEMF